MARDAWTVIEAEDGCVRESSENDLPTVSPVSHSAKFLPVTVASALRCDGAPVGIAADAEATIRLRLRGSWSCVRAGARVMANAENPG